MLEPEQVPGEYTLYGWRVRSDLSLPGLVPWVGDDRSPDVEIVIGSALKEPVDPPLRHGPFWQYWPNGICRLSLEGVARYDIIQGKRVVIEPAEGAEVNDVRVFLLGSVVGLLCHQRGLYPLHASSVRLDGRAVMVLGVSGAGKSTLSAALGRRGLPMVADDVVAIDCHAPGGIQVFPAFPVHKLTVDVMEQLAVDPQGLVINRRGQPKYLVPALGGFDPAPLPPLAAYVLRRNKGAAAGGITALEPAEAVARLEAMTYRRGIGLKVTPPGSLFFAASMLAGTVPTYLLDVREEDSLDHLDALAEAVESHARTVASK